MRPVVIFLVVCPLVAWVLVSAGCTGRDMLDSDELISGPDTTCSFRGCGKPAVGSFEFEISMGRSDNTDYYRDESRAFCAEHGKHAERGSWPEKNPWMEWFKGSITGTVVGIFFATLFGRRKPEDEA